MDNPEISIIVPIYNMERYLRQCLDSIKAQTFSNWECILVDDGSKDTSPAICDEYAAKDPRFKVIHKQNGGVSSARNIAIKAAKGNYIGFVDSDDWIDPEMYEILYKSIKDNNAEIAMVGVIKEYRGRQSIKHFVKQKKVINGLDAIWEIGHDRFPSYLCNKLQKKEIINCEFPDDRSFEDVYAYGLWLRNVKRFVIDPRTVYHYRMRIGSITHGNAAKNRYDYFIASIGRLPLFDFLQDPSIDEDWRNSYVYKAAVLAAKRIAREEQDKDTRMKAIYKISDKLQAYPLPSLWKMNPKVWLRARLLRNHPFIFSSLMRSVHVFDLDTKQREQLFYE